MIVHWYFLEFWTLLLQQLVAAIRTVLLIRVYHDCFTSIFYCLNKLKLKRLFIFSMEYLILSKLPFSLWECQSDFSYLKKNICWRGRSDTTILAWFICSFQAWRGGMASYSWSGNSDMIFKSSSSGIARNVCAYRPTFHFCSSFFDALALIAYLGRNSLALFCTCPVSINKVWISIKKRAANLDRSSHDH